MCTFLRAYQIKIAFVFLGTTYEKADSVLANFVLLTNLPYAEIKEHYDIMAVAVYC